MNKILSSQRNTEFIQFSGKTKSVKMVIWTCRQNVQMSDWRFSLLKLVFLAILDSILMSVFWGK